MNMVKVKLTLPKDLAEQAEAFGLLTNERFALMIRNALEKRRRKEEAAQRLKEMVAELHADGEQGPSLEEIDEEVRAYRKKRRELKLNSE